MPRVLDLRRRFRCLFSPELDAEASCGGRIDRKEARKKIWAKTLWRGFGDAHFPPPTPMDGLSRVFAPRERKRSPLASKFYAKASCGGRFEPWGLEKELSDNTHRRGFWGAQNPPSTQMGRPFARRQRGGRECGRRAKHPCPRSALSAMEGEWSAAAKRSCRGRTPPLQRRLGDACAKAISQ